MKFLTEREVKKPESYTLYYCGSKPYTGHWKSYYKSKKLEWEGAIKNGKRNGLFKHYYENGELKEIVNQKLNIPYGSIKFYYECGQLCFEGILNEQGKREGIWKSYHNNGRLESVGNYKNGKRDGEWKVYDYSGIYQETQYWNNGWRGYKQLLWSWSIYKKGQQRDKRISSYLRTYSNIKLVDK